MFPPSFNPARRTRTSAAILAVLTFAFFFTQNFPQQKALAQGASPAPAVNKFVVAGIPTSPPTLTTTFSNTSTASVSGTYTYVIVVDGAPGDVNITDALPAGFTPTGCTSYTGVSASTPTSPLPSTTPANCDPTNDVYGPFTTSSNPGKTILFITGTFSTAGVKVNTATATLTNSSAVSAASNPAPVSITVSTAPPITDIQVVKTASPTTIPLGGTVTYTTVLTNNSNVAVTLASLVSMLDKLSNTSDSDLEVSWGLFACVTSTGTNCFAAPTIPTWPTAGYALDAKSGVDLFGPNGIPAVGSLAVGESVTITYQVTYDSFDPCAAKPPLVSNYAYLRNGSGVGNFPDANAANNASAAPITITGLPTVCPPSPITVSKNIVTPPNPAWGQPIHYVITITNTAAAPVAFDYTDKLSLPSPAVTTVDAEVTNDVCSSGACIHTVTPATGLKFLGTAPRIAIKNASPQPKIVVPSGATFTLDYNATYSATCQVAGGPIPIMNTFKLRGRIQSTPPINTVVTQSLTVALPPLPKCAMKVKKTMTGNLNSPLPGFGPTVGTYTIAFTNTSKSVPVRMGTVWDVMSIDSAAYGTISVTYTAPSCSWMGPAGSWVYTSTAGTVQVGYAAVPWQGSQVILGSNATFPPLSTLTCTFSVKFGAPSPNDPHCQAKGTPRVVNVALIDIDPAYNPNLPPFRSAQVAKRLPLCRQISIAKVATPNPVIPGDPVTWTITITNTGPSGPIGGFTITDDLASAIIAPPGGFTLAVNGPVTCTRIPASATFPCAGSFGPGVKIGTASTGVYQPTSGLAPGQSAVIKFTTNSPTTPYTTVTNTAKAPDTAGFYYHDLNPQGTGQVLTAWPIATKAFNPTSVGKGVLSTLTFTIANLNYLPAVSGMAFNDVLPNGLTYGQITANTCTAPGGATLTQGPDVLHVSNASLTSGTNSCIISIQVSSLLCATYNNVASDVTGVVKVGTSGLNASLNVEGCGIQQGSGIPKVTKMFDPSTVGPGVVSYLTFTITNVAGNPGQSGMSFTDPLPNGLNYSNVNTTCGGTATLTGTPTVAAVLNVNGATLTAGPSSCTITMQVTTATCAMYVNNANDVTSSTNIDASGLNASLAVSVPPGVACTTTSTSSTTTSTSSTTTSTTIPHVSTGCVVGPVVCTRAITGNGDSRGYECALISYGNGPFIRCWGRWPFGGVLATQVAGITDAVAIDGGVNGVCAVRSGGTIRCFNETGLLGTGDIQTSTGTLSGITALSVGYANGSPNCALQQPGGQIYCWPWNGVASQQAGVSGATSISAGQGHACAIVVNGGAKCWGDQSRGALGNGVTTAAVITTPVDVVISGTPVTGLTSIKAGSAQTCAIQGTSPSSTILCWGRNNVGLIIGSLGTGATATDVTNPTAVAGAAGAKELSVSDSPKNPHICVVLSNNSVSCWGGGVNLQLGNAVATQAQTSPSTLFGVSVTANAGTDVHIDANSEKTCFVVGPTVKCLGSRGGGQLGDGVASGDSATPILVQQLP
jgi:uncharacterized repeat protein (TIGR01451 family)